MSKAGSGGWGMASGNGGGALSAYGVPHIANGTPDTEHRAPGTVQHTARTESVEQRGEGATIGSLVDAIHAVLERAGVLGSRREAADIVAAALNVSRLWPSANRVAIVDQETALRVHRAAVIRAAGAPFAYAVGRASFRHLTLEVDDRVLIPRQETEVLVETVLQHTLNAGGIAVDVGTGSGAIALSLASEGRFERVIGTDISSGALAVASANASRLAGSANTVIEFRHGAFLAPVAGLRVRIVVSNPPYIASREASALPPGVRDWEPPIALFSGPNGMAATARIIREAANVLEPEGLLAIEVDSRRASLAARIAQETANYHDITIRPDLTGRDRILLATRTDR